MNFILDLYFNQEIIKMIPVYYSYESFTINYELEYFIVRTLTTTFGLVFHLGNLTTRQSAVLEILICRRIFLNLLIVLGVDIR